MIFPDPEDIESGLCEVHPRKTDIHGDNSFGTWRARAEKAETHLAICLEAMRIEAERVTEIACATGCNAGNSDGGNSADCEHCRELEAAHALDKAANTI